MQIVKYFGTRILEHFVLLLGYSLVIYLALMLVNIHLAFFTFNLTFLSQSFFLALTHILFPGQSECLRQAPQTLPQFASQIAAKIIGPHLLGPKRALRSFVSSCSCSFTSSSVHIAFFSCFLSSSTSCCPFNLIAFHCITFQATSAAAFQLGFSYAFRSLTAI